MRFVLYMLMMIAVALAIGFGLSYLALTDGRMVGVVQVGPWAAWPDAGSSNPNPYTRSHLARDAELQLGQAEGLRFVADRDSTGEALTRACTYRIAGHTPLATFWTLAAVDEQGVNLAAPGTATYLRSSSIPRGDDGALSIAVGTSLMPGAWLELAGEGPYSLVLTLYDTAAFSGFSDEAAMPAILREDCR